jgi:citrate lyase subunit beta / citryl-CoA lyase
MSLTARPRRSCLYMPGANARALEKARALAADVLLLDLEDAVAPEAKEEARRQVGAAVRARGYGAREVVVRINGLDTEWGLEDLQAAVAAGPDAILAPKVETPRDIETLDAAMAEAGAGAEMALWVMVEMPKALFHILDIAAAAARTRLSAFVMGTNDLAKEMHAEMTPDRIAFQMALSRTVMAARSFGLVAIDGVFNNIQDGEGFEAECVQGRVMGFDGKTLIHPSQLETCNRVFAPADEDVAHAREVVAAFARPENKGKGVIKVDGRMTELLHLEEARRLIATHEAIMALESDLG